ncbi:hypothetical protein NDU88_003801 [Pleurodeles waltl]|uniref:Uncharacterized protein n=1 Tax=Pleurodeles waltl TaxID=8319 RepID=A0AAV7LGI1_PLEWA|nr:hypothetical protein NDU88_003801 [Pleurodeles waltl]
MVRSKGTRAALSKHDPTSDVAGFLWRNNLMRTQTEVHGSLSNRKNHACEVLKGGTITVHAPVLCLCASKESIQLVQVLPSVRLPRRPYLSRFTTACHHSEQKIGKSGAPPKTIK